MLKKFGVAFLFCLTSTIAYAQVFQSSKQVICDNTKAVMDFLAENFEEKPVWIAKDQNDETRYSLFVNQKTGSWTLLQFTPTVACFLGMGDESKYIFGDAI